MDHPKGRAAVFWVLALAIAFVAWRSGDLRRADDTASAEPEQTPPPLAALPASWPRNGRWIEISESKDHSIWVDSVTLVGGGTAGPSGWLKWSYTEAQHASYGRGYWTMRQRFAADCDERGLELGQWVTYDSTGGVVGQGRGEDSTSVVVPETIGETIFMQLCTGVRPAESLSQRAERLAREQSKR